MMATLLPIIPNEVFDTAELGRSSKLGKFDLRQDQQYGFFFNCEFQSVQYNSDKYQNEQAHSQIFVQHLQTVVKKIVSRFGQNSSVVEVGCGKGYFLGCFQIKILLLFADSIEHTKVMIHEY